MTIHEEFLKDLGAENAVPASPQIFEDPDGYGMFRGRSGVVRIEQEVRVEENLIPFHGPNPGTR